ncbi:HTH_38 domain-containing protein [Trichonephila clavipes]|nr:HTH_38 domain-containing protein [Trichonephila clavipes]
MSRRKQRSAFDQVSEFDRGRIVAYRDCGLSFREIGSRVGRNQTTVIRICDLRMQKGTTDRRRQSHPPQCTTSREDRQANCAHGSDGSLSRITNPEWSVRKTSIAWSTLDAEPQANGAMKEGCGWQNGIKLSLLTSHVSVCHTTMVGLESGDTVDAEQLRYAPPHWPCTRTATAGSDVVQSGRPIFDDFFQHLWPYIGKHGECCLPNGQTFVAYPHRPMTLHSPTKNSLAVLNHKILEANSQVQNVKLGGHQTCLSINRLWHELWDILRRLVGTTAPGHHDCSIQE